MELTVVIGGFIICASQFYLHTAQHATAVLTIFLASSTRIAPAILRIQQSGLSLKQNAGASLPTLELIRKLNLAKLSDEATEEPSFLYPEFNSEIFLKRISYKYPNSSNLVISDLSLTIKKGSIVSIVGASGAGKTTLVDIILGIKKPVAGEVLISGVIPEEAINRWPGSIAYVPQDVAIINGSIQDNIILGYPNLAKYNSKIQKASEVASLTDFIKSLPQGINSLVGERGNKISGGQRQRIGIARAMFTSPLLLVLDEATSSLDGITEHDITKSILSMRGDVTVIIIAHRLSTVINSDLVVYLDNGKILASGKFNEVRNMVPNFDRQVRLADLESQNDFTD
jgi:ABC-type bacteriocin/lantibiotic exporter with double-glycine peptidase domain